MGGHVDPANPGLALNRPIRSRISRMLGETRDSHLLMAGDSTQNTVTAPDKSNKSEEKRTFVSIGDRLMRPRWKSPIYILRTHLGKKIEIDVTTSISPALPPP